MRVTALLSQYYLTDSKLREKPVSGDVLLRIQNAYVHNVQDKFTFPRGLQNLQ